VKSIYEFGESDSDQWYRLDGEQVECDEDITQHLWMQWVKHRDPRRREEDDYTIYSVFKNPMKIK